MLFDLRGAGRRTTVKVVYLSLAILMGGGLVFFGIGGDVSGGLFDAIREGDSATPTSVEEFQKKADDAERRAQAEPQDPDGWAEAARARYQLASASIDRNTGTFSEAAQADLQRAVRSWERHLALKPDPPDDSVARQMVIAYGPAGLNELEEAVTAQEIVAESRPTSRVFVSLATIAYQAGQIRKGDLAADRAVELADPDERKTLKAEIDQQKQAALAQQIQDSGASPTATPTAGSGGKRNKKSDAKD